MPGMQLVEDAVLAPGRCIACGGVRGPMVDTLVAVNPPTGRVYVCQTCVEEAAALIGWPPPHEVAQQVQLLEDRAVAAEAIAADLNDRLDHAEASKVVPLEDVRKLVAETRQEQSA